MQIFQSTKLWIIFQECMASEKTTIRTDFGEIVEATAPVIISASRSTDIPAFMPNGSSTAWLKVIALGTILLTSKKCISLSRIAK